MTLMSEITPAVELVGITKKYPGVVANNDISLVLNKGEVHSLLGENGAGKSTLIGILSGMVRPDSGKVLINGRCVVIESPKDALALGIGTVYQHSLLVPSLSVLENLLLGMTHGLRSGREKAITRLQELAALLGVEIDPDSIVGELSLGQRQQVEIVRALWRGEGVLILDEPTSMLTPQGAVKLSLIVRKLVEKGLAVVFITHKMNEALDLGDRVTVLRRGKIVGEIKPEELKTKNRELLTNEVLELIFGENSDLEQTRSRKTPNSSNEIALAVEGLTLSGDDHLPLLDGVTLSVARGEIYGIAGIDGNGQKELAEVIAGQRPISRGKIFVDGKLINDLAISDRQALGIRYVTDDRHGEGTVGPLSVALNFFQKRIGEAPYWRRSLIRTGLIRDFAKKLIFEHDVRTPNEDVAISTLSGGNMQKVILARELAMSPRVVVYNKPTYGLDARTTATVLSDIVKQANSGVATLFISTDLNEIISICNKVSVIYRGKLSEPNEISLGIEKKLGAMMTGSSAV